METLARIGEHLWSSAKYLLSLALTFSLFAGAELIHEKIFPTKKAAETDIEEPVAAEPASPTRSLASVSSAGPRSEVRHLAGGTTTTYQSADNTPERSWAGSSSLNSAEDTGLTDVTPTVNGAMNVASGAAMAKVASNAITSEDSASNSSGSNGANSPTSYSAAPKTSTGTSPTAGTLVWSSGSWDLNRWGP